ncbi:MAG: glycosyltransferase family 2 protein [Phycisphaerales bacterium JB040]
MRLAVVIVNYKTGHMVADCLRSIADTTQEHARPAVYVVDNASPDDSADVIERAIASDFAPFATLVRADRNGGFSYGNNTGIRRALSDDPELGAILLLNPDTIVLPGALGVLSTFLEHNPEAGLVGARLLNPGEAGEPGPPQRSAFRFPSIASEFEACAQVGLISRLLRSRMVAPPPRNEPHTCDWLSGAALCVRRAVLQDVGPMDEAYFLYYEETDFCRRAAALGHTCWHVPDARIVHLEGQATGVAHSRPKRRPGFWFDSRRLYFTSHHGRLYAAAADLAAVLGTAIARTKHLLLRRPIHSPPHYATDLIRQGALTQGVRARRNGP